MFLVFFLLDMSDKKSGVNQALESTCQLPWTPAGGGTFWQMILDAEKRAGF